MKKNLLANFIGRFWSILSNFLFIPLYIHYLGFESYSIISFSLIIAGIMAILDGGLTATLSREIARKDISKHEKLRIFKTLESSYIIIIIFSISLLMLGSNTIAENWLNLINFKPEKVSLLIKIISLDVGFQLLFRFFIGGLMGLEKQVKSNFFHITWGVVRNGLVIIAIWFIPSLEMFFAWQSITTIIFTLVLGFTVNRELDENFNKLNFKIEKKILKKIIGFAGGMLLISVVASINTQLDKLVISKLLPIETLGYYTLAVSMGTIILISVSPFSITTLPRFTSLYSQGKQKEASKLFDKISLVVGIIVFSLITNIIFFSKELLWIWTGDIDIADSAYQYVPFMAISYGMLSLAIIPFNVAIANGYTKLNNQLGLISLFLTIPGYLIATKYFNAIGAAVVYCFVQTTITIIYLYIINKKFIKNQSFVSMLFKQIIKPLFISFSIVLLLSFIPRIYQYSRFLSLIWIGFSLIITIVATLLILIPLDKLNFKKEII
jgi:O-antigen/teichoic acid export membrane protein